MFLLYGETTGSRLYKVKIIVELNEEEQEKFAMKLLEYYNNPAKRKLSVLSVWGILKFLFTHSTRIKIVKPEPEKSL